MISKLDGLAGLENLRNLDLQTNCLDDIDNIQDLKKLPALQSLDLKSNQIDARDQIVSFFAEIPSLHALYLKGNPCVRYISKYRKTMTEQLPKLNYLDDRPIFDHERIVADAFVRGGEEEVNKVKEEM
jgi:Leucine-rich repeat (LRR) protein